MALGSRPSLAVATAIANGRTGQLNFMLNLEAACY